MPEPSVAARVGACLLVTIGITACGPGGSSGTPATYAIQFEISNLPDGDDLEAISFSVAYSGGSFVGSDTNVSCTLQQDDDAEAEFEDNDSGTLTIDIEGATPADPLVEDTELVVCDFLASTQPTSTNFTITVTSADPSAPKDVDVAVTSTDLAGSATIGEVSE